MNKRWRWVQNGDCYELRFTKFYDEETVLKLVPDSKEAGCYIYVSEELHVEYDEIYAGSIEEAKQELEDIYRIHLEDKVEYWSDMLDKWESEE